MSEKILCQAFLRPLSQSQEKKWPGRETMAGGKQKQASQAASCHHTMCGFQSLSGVQERKQVGHQQRAQAAAFKMVTHMSGQAAQEAWVCRACSTVVV
jgi:hypothetical protein